MTHAGKCRNFAADYIGSCFDNICDEGDPVFDISEGQENTGHSTVSGKGFNPSCDRNACYLLPEEYGSCHVSPWHTRGCGCAYGCCASCVEKK